LILGSNLSSEKKKELLHLGIGESFSDIRKMLEDGSLYDFLVEESMGNIPYAKKSDSLDYTMPGLLGFIKEKLEPLGRS
jgi:hypothetical protein